MADKTCRFAKIAISLFSLILLFSTTAHAKIFYVDDDGPTDFDNIQAAIDDSNHGDTIIVSPGTYTGDGNRDINYNGKAITVRSEDPNDPNIVVATIIDCNGTEDQPHRGFFFNAGEEANSVLAGLTITNGYAYYGGGIYCEASRPTITNCTLIANSALLGGFGSVSRGGGISCQFCSLKGPSLPGMATNPIPSDGAIGVGTTVNLMWSAGFFAESHDVYFGTSNPPPFIRNQTFTIFNPNIMTTGTTYYWRVDEINTLGKTIGTLWGFTTGGPPPPPMPLVSSGEIEEQSSPEMLSDAGMQGPTITNCIFIDNLADEGGGMYTQESNPILNNCTFSGNEGSDGGGMFTEGSNPILIDCTFSENSSAYGGGVFNWYDSNTTLTDCIFSDNFAYFSGGGIYNDESTRLNLSNCTFKGNSTYYYGYMSPEGGGGIYNYRGTPNLIDCKFIGNSSYRGGGMLNLSHTDMSLTGCVFIENSADDGYGGGLYSANPNTILTDCIFSNNSADRGGGMYNVVDSASLNRCMFNGNSAVLGGGMYNGIYSTITLTNCLFSGNWAEHQYSGPIIIYPPVYGYGGGIYDEYGGTKVINCSFNKNRASGEGGAIWLKYPLPPPTPPFPFPTGLTSSDTMTEIPAIMDVNDSNVSLISNCIVWGNQDSDGTGELSQIRIDPNEIPVVINYSCIQGWTGDWGGTGNIDADPCFVQLGFWHVIWRNRVPEYVWNEGYYQLLPESHCIDAGDPNYIAEPNETDLDGSPRVIGGLIDMGAYEYFNVWPVADAGPDQVVECACNTQEGTKVTLDGTGSYDMGNNPLNFTWSGPFVQSPVHGAAPTVTLEGGCPGDYVITLVVNNGIEDSEPNEIVITIVDTTPPEFALSVSPTVLWPPSHKMVEITPSWTVSDECDAAPQVSLVGIVMSEDDNTAGDGRTTGDIEIGEDGSIYLRAERSGTSSDRVYTITYQAVDDSGNAAVGSATVGIPHDFKVLAGIAARWLWIKQTGRIPEDLNDDGVVNFMDFAKFADNWIK
ncbi:MAG: hypothetical protein FVQ85_02370 [Planctomycetes bacterium]|nr:hypothetical protein [Planctomycetota bacterium]